MPNYTDLSYLAVFLVLLAYASLVVKFSVIKEKLKHTETRMYSAEHEVIKLNKLILILVTPKPKNVVKVVGDMRGAFSSGKLEGFTDGFERGREYQILNPDSKIEQKVDEI